MSVIKEEIETIEEAKKEFSVLYNNIISRIEDSSLENHNDVIDRLKRIDSFVQRQALFSPNEELDDINDEDLPFLFLPFLIGRAYTQGKLSDRKFSLIEGQKYLKSYIQLVNHYRILPKTVNEVFEAYSTNPSFRIDREQKVKLFKEEKEIDSSISSLAGKDSPRQLHRLRMLKSTYQSISDLLFIPQELELLSFREKLETDSEAKRIYQEFQSQPVPKIQATRIEAQQPTIQSTQIEHIQPQVDVFGNDFNAPIGKNVNDLLNQRQKIIDTLNQHSYSQPIMTLDEFDELEYTLLKEREKKNEVFQKKKKQEYDRLGIENSDDSENELVSEIKTYKAREWENWKDENEKGSGNRNGR